MTYEETIAHLQDKTDEHHDVLHRLISLVDKLHDRIARLEARVESIYSPEADEQPWHTH